jgi:1-acyl-sn-glycerol-3-phosphate acyltransferase
MRFKIARLLIRLLYRLLTTIQVIGEENIPPDGGIVAVTNHIGRLDPGLVYCLVDRQDIIMLVAEKYRQGAIFRWLTAALDGVWVDRFGADLTAIRTCLRRLKKGGALVIAPEGTRSPSGALMTARSGAGYLAAKSGAPIVPTAIVGTEDAVVKARLRSLRRVNVVVRFGKPFRLAPSPGLDPVAQVAAYDDEIMCRIAALLPLERRGAYADHLRLKDLLSSAPVEAAPGPGPMAATSIAQSK